ncbi:unnamed protein product [Rhizoctonia solani]|uniref:Uncharacterized protein n=1 Tax=Rhizoctonia solani TaxID=456999 RepID=A0A8H3H434_9AGAM|nr:unnamed protein product [Rhizoctonia solani]
MGSVSATKSSRRAKAAKSTKPKDKPIPKRVTIGFRVPFNYYEWSKLIEAWYSAKVQGYPDKATLNGLATQFGRCLKQINTFYTNRRQDVANKQAATRKLTEEELYELLWAKYTGTPDERMIAKHKGLSVREAMSSSSKPSSSKSSSPTPSLTMSEGSSTDTTSSEGSIESSSSAGLSVAYSTCSQWSDTVTPAMAELLKVVNERLSEFNVSEAMLSL